MDIFNEDTAAFLQYFTFPLEVIGISLALIEVRFQNLTRRLNLRLKRTYDLIKASEKRFYEKHLWLKSINDKVGTDLPAPGWLQTFFFGLIITAIIAASAVIASKVLRDQGLLTPYIHEANRLLFMDFIVWIYFPGFVLTTIILLMLIFTVRFVEDRAVGTVGILIASLGLIGEAYQLAPQIILV
jgi:hypothetical protein